MSSVGPSIVVITEKSRMEIEDMVRSLGLSIAVATAVDNEGLKIDTSE